MAKHQAGELLYYTSDLLDQHGIKHGFFTRLGGVSQPPFDSLNVKRSIGDSTENVDENRRRICHSLGLDYKKLVFAHLGHKDKVHVASQANASTDIANVDALISSERGLSLMLSVADCVPIVLASRNQTVVALIHVSWRSLAAGIIENAMRAISEFNKQPDDLMAGFGPAIRMESYEVGEELIKAVSPKFKKFLKEKNDKIYFDIPAAAKHQLQELGLKQIDDLNIDTYTHTDEFYSYRKEGNTGRFAAVVSL